MANRPIYLNPKWSYPVSERTTPQVRRSLWVVVVRPPEEKMMNTATMTAKELDQLTLERLRAERQKINRRHRDEGFTFGVRWAQEEGVQEYVLALATWARANSCDDPSKLTADNVGLIAQDGENYVDFWRDVVFLRNENVSPLVLSYAWLKGFMMGVVHVDRCIG
jgi:hypothetical protein